MLRIKCTEIVLSISECIHALFHLLLGFQNFQDKEEDPLRIDDIPEIDNVASSEINSKFTAYLSQGDSEKHREPFYCRELGFAMEKLLDGYTIKDLWNVMGTAGK